MVGGLGFLCLLLLKFSVDEGKFLHYLLLGCRLVCKVFICVISLLVFLLIWVLAVVAWQESGSRGFWLRVIIQWLCVVIQWLFVVIQ